MVEGITITRVSSTDPDFLVVGGLGLGDGSPDYVGERTQFSIWAIMKVTGSLKSTLYRFLLLYSKRRS